MHRKLSFTIAEGPIYWRTHRIMELCDYLTANVLEPMFARDGAKWNRRFMDFFTFDNACDPLEPTGTIRFAVPPLFAGRVGELETAITQELAKLRIKIGPFQYERDPVLQTVKTILISITENPTALAAPPDVNMSHTRGCVVLRDLLGYQRVNGRYEFMADDLRQTRLLRHRGQDRRLHRQPGEGCRRRAPHAQPHQHEGGAPLPGRGQTVRPLGPNHNHRKLAAV